MANKTLVVIDLQNDNTPYYKEIIHQVNNAIEWATEQDIPVVYIKHNFPFFIPRTFKAGTNGEKLVDDLKIVSNNIFTKTRASALTSKPFVKFIKENAIVEFYITGALSQGCVKATSCGLTKAGYQVTVFSDCITSDKKSLIPKMLNYYKRKGCEVLEFSAKDIR